MAARPRRPKRGAVGFEPTDPLRDHQGLRSAVGMTSKIEKMTDEGVIRGATLLCHLSYAPDMENRGGRTRTCNTRVWNHGLQSAVGHVSRDDEGVARDAARESNPPAAPAAPGRTGRLMDSRRQSPRRSHARSMTLRRGVDSDGGIVAETMESEPAVGRSGRRWDSNPQTARLPASRSFRFVTARPVRRDREREGSPESEPSADIRQGAGGTPDSWRRSDLGGSGRGFANTLRINNGCTLEGRRVGAGNGPVLQWNDQRPAGDQAPAFPSIHFRRGAVDDGDCGDDPGRP